MSPIDTIVPATAILVAVVAAVLDVRTRRIPNVLTLGAAVAGLLFHAFTSGLDGAAASLGGWLVGGLLFLPFFVLGGMGGGDVKLLAALGAWLGAIDVVWLAVYSGLAGGVLGLYVAVMHGYLRTAVANIAGMFSYWAAVGLGPVPGRTLESTGTPRLAYAVAILAGTVVTIWR